ncbi:MAG: FG-GAP-like repeat-containing protein, partial [Gemmatimonadota bacterium]|nr:FG-GAP-like repeat-containing protein [Gemmatimonadota bacterium]
MPHISVKVRQALLPLAVALLGAACGQGPPEESPAWPPKARWHNNQGVVYMDQHNYTRGREEFARALALAPDYASAQANLGISYYALGKYDSAATALQTALAIDPALLHANYALGLIYNAQGREHDKALAALQKVAAADRDDPHVRYYMGQMRAKLNEGEAAIADFKEAIRLDPYNVSAYYGLANLYRRLGREEEWKSTLERFNQLSQAGHQGVSSSYQGQGKYAEAVADAGGGDPSQDDVAGPFAFAAAGPAAGPVHFAALGDFDADGRPDVLAGAEGLHLYAGGTAEMLTAPTLPDDFGATGAISGDLDNDGTADLVLSGAGGTLLYRAANGEWADGEGLSAASTGVALGDADHDGDLDLIVLGSSVSLLANDGEARFVATGQPVGPVAADRAVFSDLDNDRDVDIVLLSAEGLQVQTNNRDGTFSEIADALGLGAVQGAGLAVEDFNQDGYMDLAIAASGTVETHINQAGRAFVRAEAAASGERALLSADFDNDGDLDLLACEDERLQPLAYGGGQFQPQSPIDESGGAAVVADFNGDGRVDIWAGGRVLHNQSEGGHWIEIAAQGLNSNRDGVGAKVEVKTTHRLQKREIRSEGYAGVLHFGLAQSDSVEFIRILWPGGVRQTELATGAGQRLELTELDRKGTSCPILYAWDGERYRFVTDILGGAIIGYLTAPGQYYQPDTDEYVRLGPLAPKDGHYVLQLANQLEEIIYVDALELVAVDHPPEFDIYPNERLLSAPPYPEFKLYPLQGLRPPVAARDHRGADVLAVLQEIDDEWY